MTKTPTSTVKLQSGVRFRAYPEGTLPGILARWIGCQRFIFNGKVSEDRYFAGMRRLLIASGEVDVKTPLDQQYAQFKNDELTPWLSEVPSQILRNAVDRFMNAKKRQMVGLSRAPRRRNRSNFNSVLVTNELFRFKTVKLASGVEARVIELGTVAKPVGILRFKAHVPYGTPKQITLRKQGRNWFVSFSYEHDAPDGVFERETHELAHELDLLDDDMLAAATLGVDRNVRSNCVATSDGRFYGLSEVQKERLARKEVGAQRYHRRMSRKTKGSKNQARCRDRLAAKKSYEREVRRDFSHQTSNDLLVTPIGGAVKPLAIVQEALKITNMVRRPKAKKGANGRWQRNGAKRKAGLNKAILASCWGSINEQLKYKSGRRGILFFEAPAAYSSQECSQCAHTQPENRAGDRFLCQGCGYTEHADTNAAVNIRSRGVEIIRSGVLKEPKAKKRLNKPRRKSKTGLERSDVPVEGS